MKDLIVIGGGPSGIAATAYAEHLGLDTVLVAPDVGGKVNYRFSVRGLDNVSTVYGDGLVRTLAARIRPTTLRSENAHGVEATADGFRVQMEGGDTVSSRALLIATGARPRRLFVPGERELWGRGLSYSATSHAPLFVGRDVAVVGNDWRAQVAALELARVTRTVYFITPQPQALDEALLQRLAESGNVQLFRGWEVTYINGSDYVDGITLQNSDGVTRQLAVEGVFVEMGLIPNSGLVSHLVPRNERGHIVVDQHNATGHPGLYAAGDVTDAPGEQVPIALGEGIKAALSISAFVARRPTTQGEPHV